MNQESQPRDGTRTLRPAAGLLVFGCRSLAVTLEVMLHKSGTFGERYLGLNVGGAILMMLFAPALVGSAGALDIWLLLPVFMLRCVWIRTRIFARRFTNAPLEHTRYTGQSRFERLLPFLSEVSIKRFVEPMVSFVLGSLLMSVSPALGGYIMIAAMGLAAAVHLSVAELRARALDMNDALMDQRRVADRWRAMRSDS